MGNIQISKLAREVLLETVVESELSPDEGLRMEEVGGKLILSTDKPSPNDHTVKAKDHTLIIVDKELEQKIGDATIDIRRKDKELKLMIIKKEEEQREAR